MNVAENAEYIQKKIARACQKTNRNPQNVNVIAVTKYVSTSRAKEALEAGIKHLGENYSEGLIEKYESIGSEATWHFIGTLQSRKVKTIIDKVDYLHSLDRISVAKQIEKYAANPVKCFVQVNISEEETKHGLKCFEVEDFIEELKNYQKIEVVGLMTMAPYTDNYTYVRKIFRELRELKENIESKNLPYAPCHELSMGMSNDYDIAVEEGATFVRIGSALVGRQE